MSQERIEAAAKAAYVEYSQEPGFDAEAAWDDMGGTEDYETGIWALTAQAALAAADAVMFSDEAIERAAKALNAEHAPAWEILPDWVKDDWRKQVRTVVAALKGDA